MDQNRLETVTSRLRGPLRGVIAAVGALGVLAATLVDPPEDVDQGRAGVPVPDVVTDPAAIGAPVPDAGAGSVPDGGPPPDGSAVAAPPPSAGAATPSLGPAAVPVAGTYRYEVRSTQDGRSSVQEEHRDIVPLSGDRSDGRVQITARIDGESQVSVIDWSPAGALVRSTRIESAAGASQDCSWTPPFAEIGPLAAGSSWSLDSTCRTDVGGIDTTFVVTGTGRVVGTATIGFEGRDVPVWQVERDRTTSIRASLGDERLEQEVHEQGTFWWDPARGIVMRSDVTVTLEGEQEGVTQRTSVLLSG